MTNTRSHSAAAERRCVTEITVREVAIRRSVAFTAASVAGLTVYDMIKAVDPGAVVGPFQLHEKLGGKTGRWTSQP